MLREGRTWLREQYWRKYRPPQEPAGLDKMEGYAHERSATWYLLVLLCKVAVLGRQFSVHETEIRHQIMLNGEALMKMTTTFLPIG